MDGLRIDVLLHRLCLTRSRSEARAACDAGAVVLQGRTASASDTVNTGERFSVLYPGRWLEVELLTLPAKSTSRPQARECYRTLRDQQEPPA